MAALEPMPHLFFNQTSLVAHPKEQVQHLPSNRNCQRVTSFVQTELQLFFDVFAQFICKCSACPLARRATMPPCQSSSCCPDFVNNTVTGRVVDKKIDV